MRLSSAGQLAQRNTPGTGSTTLLLALGTALLALVVRLHHLGFESLFMDEWHQVSVYSAPWSQITELAASMQQPPLDYWIGHWIVTTFGDNDFMVRLPAVVFGTAAVFVITILAGRLCSPPVALFTGLLAALLPFNIYFSQEARPYAIAHFFYLLLLTTLARHFTAVASPWMTLSGVWIAATAFLYARSLSPLVAMLCLIGLLVLHTVWLRWRGQPIRRPLTAVLALVLALAAFLPIFGTIVAYGARYLRHHATGFSLDMLVSGLATFNITDLWQAYRVQTEPLTWPLSVLLVMSPWMLWRSGLWQRHPLWPYLLALLPLESLLELVVFFAKTDLPYRPPYAIHLLPLVLLWVAGGAQAMLDLTRSHAQARLFRLMGVGLGLVMIAQTMATLVDFKLLRKKTDWRAAYAYCTEHLGPQQIIVFASLTRPGDWEPTFYVAERYYGGRSPLLGIRDIPTVAGRLQGQPLEPVVMLFQWHEYYLTTVSRYPFVPMPGGDRPFPVVNYGGIPRDHRLQVTSFKGMMVIKLKEPHGEFTEDAYRLITAILDHLPEHDGLVSGYSAVWALANVLGWSDQAAMWRQRMAAVMAAQPAR